MGHLSFASGGFLPISTSVARVALVRFLLGRGCKCARSSSGMCSCWRPMVAATFGGTNSRALLRRCCLPTPLLLQQLASSPPSPRTLSFFSASPGNWRRITGAQSLARSSDSSDSSWTKRISLQSEPSPNASATPPPSSTPFLESRAMSPDEAYTVANSSRLYLLLLGRFSRWLPSVDVFTGCSRDSGMLPSMRTSTPTPIRPSSSIGTGGSMCRCRESAQTGSGPHNHDSLWQ
mmetsp:Transcript_38965/g.93339  ORF Transcript_38965/g.93339 Transcript_38965/m.93339 type:complete len:234 (+) Transcript_38965:314-1015(+)